MHPESERPAAYDKAMYASPIASAFIDSPEDSETFLNAIAARGGDMEIKHPDFIRHQVRTFVILGQCLNLLPYPAEDDNEKNEVDASNNAETLFLIGYELGTDENIEWLFSSIFKKVSGYGYIDFDESSRTKAEAYVHMVLLVGAHYKNMDNKMRLDPNLEPPIALMSPPDLPDENETARRLLNW
ncbi:MAG: hypothetical protein Q7S79_02020 [bacterium]|nr:hypothetical protein [bacterium]